ncbi:hypothetical protein [Pedobacter antarcticus]|uniref:hypothetical protein n=1 Tax=Pedobacter antarcticus TaxID=34086 RepID=UPI001C59E2A2|nr:hypothetical protein [Pedobacter antarcticus]
MTEEKPESFKHLNQILIFMTDRPYDQSDIMKLDRNYENTGFLALPATYKVFIQEIERLIK